ncbi:hypothetical protein [Vreelandella sp. EE7]
MELTVLMVGDRILDELADGFLKTVLRLFGVVVRTLIWLIWELFFLTLAWYIGWSICRALTLNHFPRQFITDEDEASDLVHTTVSLVGLLALLGAAIVIAKLVGSG